MVSATPTIVPATTASDREEVASKLGYDDEAVVVGEPFRQWVIQRDFAGPVPAWDRTTWARAFWVASLSSIATWMRADSVIAENNVHHVVEASFKAFARALRMACAADPAMGLPSTKGKI